MTKTAQPSDEEFVYIHFYNAADFDGMCLAALSPAQKALLTSCDKKRHLGFRLAFEVCEAGRKAILASPLPAPTNAGDLIVRITVTASRRASKIVKINPGRNATLLKHG